MIIIFNFNEVTKRKKLLKVCSTELIVFSYKVVRKFFPKVVEKNNKLTNV